MPNKIKELPWLVATLKKSFNINFLFFSADLSDQSEINLLNCLNVKPKKDTLSMQSAMKKYYKENFSDWFEPGSQINNNNNTNSLQTR